MSNSLAMQFGSSGRANNSTDGMKLIAKGEINDSSTITLELEAGGFYLLAAKEYTAETGAYRGHRLHVVASPETDYFGSAACQRINTLHSDYYGVDITYNADSTITLVRSSATYAVRYALYRMF